MSFDPASLIAGLLVSSVGFVLFEYGRRMKRPPQMGVGLILLIFPYFVASVWAMLGIAVLLVAALWLALVRGL
jgi:hypothetical protein